MITQIRNSYIHRQPSQAQHFASILSLYSQCNYKTHAPCCSCFINLNSSTGNLGEIQSRCYLNTAKLSWCTGMGYFWERHWMGMHSRTKCSIYQAWFLLCIVYQKLSWVSALPLAINHISCFFFVSKISLVKNRKCQKTYLDG